MKSQDLNLIHARFKLWQTPQPNAQMLHGQGKIHLLYTIWISKSMSLDVIELNFISVILIFFIHPIVNSYSHTIAAKRYNLHGLFPLAPGINRNLCYCHLVWPWTWDTYWRFNYSQSFIIFVKRKWCNFSAAHGSQLGSVY